jgi:hypothetical protein
MWKYRRKEDVEGKMEVASEGEGKPQGVTGHGVRKSMEMWTLGWWKKRKGKRERVWVRGGMKSRGGQGRRE